jgi:aryl-alcohol dehydrogenase-like predicted oxidoreductase
MDVLPLSADPLPLGASGLSCRPLAWGFRPAPGARLADARAALAAAAEAGFGLVTVAGHPAPGSRDAFGSAETLLGEALQAEPHAAGQMLLAVRGGIQPGPIYDSRAESLVAALDASLQRLGRTTIDLFILQRADWLAHPAEVAEAFATILASGRARAVGLAHHGAPRLRALFAHVTTPLASLEVPLSALDPAALAEGLLDLAMEKGLAVVASAPLAEGQIGDRPDFAASVTHRATLRALDAIAGQQGVGRAAVAAAFVAAHPARPIPLFGTQDPAELRGAADLFRVRLSRADWYRLLEAAIGHRLPALDADR